MSTTEVQQHHYGKYLPNCQRLCGSQYTGKVKYCGSVLVKPQIGLQCGRLLREELLPREHYVDDIIIVTIAENQRDNNEARFTLRDLILSIKREKFLKRLRDYSDKTKLDRRTGVAR